MSTAIGITVVTAFVPWTFIVRNWKTLDPKTRTVLYLSAAAVVAICCAALAVNTLRPSIIRQYVSPLVPFLLVGASIGAAPLFNRPRWLLAFLGGAILSNGAYALQRSAVKDQETLAAFLGRKHAQCPSRIIAIPPRFAGVTQINVAVTDAAYRSNYGVLAVRFGFRLNGPPAPHCPSFIWGESFRPSISIAELASRAGLAVNAGQVDGAQVQTSKTGFVVIFPALSETQSATR